ncbi:hypothetical protein ACIA8K_06960 [Catenuloplanes sp. NPDC051500]|uniref:hypothetical protein n=1 Tax=Catenuloplanes sp. NPDC051500 TaxID=3363959 RepID=UPI00379A4941
MAVITCPRCDGSPLNYDEPPTCDLCEASFESAREAAVEWYEKYQQKSAFESNPGEPQVPGPVQECPQCAAEAVTGPTERDLVCLGCGAPYNATCDKCQRLRWEDENSGGACDDCWSGALA